VAITLFGQRKSAKIKADPTIGKPPILNPCTFYPTG